MSLDIFNDAFKSLSILNENLFDTSTLGVTKLHSFMDDDFEEDTVDIIDPNASTDEELSDSYIGKVIVDCNVCHSHIFKDREEIDIDESGLVNGEEMCPYCGEQEGFVIIGQIEAFNENATEESTDDHIEEPTEDIPTEEIPEEEDEDEIDESLKESVNADTLTEAEGNDLASRVLAYLDKLEARGELTESMNNVKVETDDNIVTVNSDESGKVTVTTEPVEAGLPEGEGEMIAPLSDDEMNSIMDSDVDVPAEGEEIPADVDTIEEPIAEEMPLEDDEVDIDMEEIDEESLDNLGESYLKKVYENVDSYKTNSTYMRGDKIIVEGLIKFTSGKEKKTGFILEAKAADNRGRVTFSGYNAHLTTDKSAYLFEGRVTDKKLTFNKLSYRYALNENLISGRVYRR